MPGTKTVILENAEILQKIDRIAWQILENNYNQQEIVLIGIENKGTVISELIGKALQRISDKAVVLGTVTVDKDNPTMNGMHLNCAKSLKGASVVLVDDVLNSGRTLMYATLPILAQAPRKLHTAILANRDHNRFPIKADYVGISLATTLKEHILFTNEGGEMQVALK